MVNRKGIGPGVLAGALLLSLFGAAPIAAAVGDTASTPRVGQPA